MTLVLVTEQRNQPGASKGNRAVKGSKCQHCAPVILNNSQSQPRVRLVQLSTFAPAHTPRKQIYIVSQAPPRKHTMVPAERNTTGESYKQQMLWCVWSSGFSTRQLCSTTAIWTCSKTEQGQRTGLQKPPVKLPAALSMALQLEEPRTLERSPARPWLWWRSIGHRVK